MRIALVDSSTLTGVQRLLGQISVRNKSIVDMDILCLESLIEAILFYDIVSVVDDYKPQFRESRRRAFPEIRVIGSGVISIQQLVKEAKTLTEDIVPRVEAGHFTDKDFQPFFDMLKMNVTFTWDMASSVYFLTQKMLAGVGGLDLEKYSKLTSAIYSELLNKSRSEVTDIDTNKMILKDTQGNLIESAYSVSGCEGGGLSGQASAFFAGLNWLAFRTIFYTLAANSLKVDLFLHPIRHAFQTNSLYKLQKPPYSDFKPVIDAMNDVANKSINTITSRTQPFATRHAIPLFVTWLATKETDPRRYISLAYELRQERPFKEARNKLMALETHLAEDNGGKHTTDANKLILEVDKALEGLISKYGANTMQGISLSSVITLWNLGAIANSLPKLPNINTRLPQLEFLKHVIPQSGFKSIYRSLVSDLVEVSRLGKYHEIISSRIVIDENATGGLEKVELNQYRRATSSFKTPM
jgi:hypothetical protein